mmetsp:Transcript_41128/g.88787  ORF Transcript_41128/g.88787 Transcript_41128/m.88787 type:complete len:217 (+) Transcript_41128:692-1342(+)
MLPTGPASLNNNIKLKLVLPRQAGTPSKLRRTPTKSTTSLVGWPTARASQRTKAQTSRRRATTQRRRPTKSTTLQGKSLREPPLRPPAHPEASPRLKLPRWVAAKAAKVVMTRPAFSHKLVNDRRSPPNNSNNSNSNSRVPCKWATAPAAATLSSLQSQVGVLPRVSRHLPCLKCRKCPRSRGNPCPPNHQILSVPLWPQMRQGRPVAEQQVLVTG